MSIMNNKFRIKLKISAQYDSREYKEFKLSFSRLLTANKKINTKKNSKENSSCGFYNKHQEYIFLSRLG